MRRQPAAGFPWHRNHVGEPPVALITGASSGIGAEFARQLAAYGYDLVLVARRAEGLQILAGELESAFGVQVEFLPADLATDGGVSVVEARVRSLDRLEVLVNAAGFGLVGRLMHADPEKQQRMVYLHVMATMRLTQAALPGMVARQRGAIVNVSSVAAFLRRGRGSVNYIATKAYINVFSQVLQAELRGTGVQVQALCPGFTRTGFHETAEYARFRREQYPAFMWQTAEEVVRGSLAAVGNGQVIVVPGALYRLLVAIMRMVRV
ncbi:MAG: SDR family oxidoreductase [Caldilineaceae bacterium]|nr:SDR family oxidoreductase [Caldilineaceae bacterium]